MLRRVELLVLGCLTLVGGSVRAQTPSAPLQLNPGTVLLPDSSGAAHAAVPNNWKIVDSGRDPLTEMPQRTAVTLPKSDSNKNANLGVTGLALICFSANPNGPTHPVVALVFTALPGLGHYKKFATQYRFDEEPLRSVVWPAMSARAAPAGLFCRYLPTRIRSPRSPPRNSFALRSTCTAPGSYFSISTWLARPQQLRPLPANRAIEKSLLGRFLRQANRPVQRPLFDREQAAE